MTLPLLGEIHVPSAFVFDLGVFLVVVGTTMLILVALVVLFYAIAMVRFKTS